MRGLGAAGRCLEKAPNHEWAMEVPGFCPLDPAPNGLPEKREELRATGKLSMGKFPHCY